MHENIGTRIWHTIVWLLTAIFIVNLVLLIASVVLDSFAGRWLGT